jgi:hypothetical protein
MSETVLTQMIRRSHPRAKTLLEYSTQNAIRIYQIGDYHEHSQTHLQAAHNDTRIFKRPEESMA